MKFSIVTPSFRNSKWLKLCIASVADQQGVEWEHIVQDSCSDDSTQDWLPRDPRVKAFIEKDGGMYDAVNCGYRRATGDILAYLNCDEQYLPGALKAVHEFFEQHPQIEVALAGTIITDGEGKYICHRHLMVPHPQGVWFRFPILTSSIFIRRKVISERRIFSTRAGATSGISLGSGADKKPGADGRLRFLHLHLCRHRREHESEAERHPRKGGNRRDDAALGARVEAILDFPPSSCAGWPRDIFPEGGELFHLHAAKPGAARDLRCAQADRRLAEPAFEFSGCANHHLSPWMR